MPDYKDLGLDQNMMSTSSLPNLVVDTPVSIKRYIDDNFLKMQRGIKTSTVSVPSLIGISGTASSQFSLDTFHSWSITARLNYLPPQNTQNFLGLNHLSFYEGTAVNTSYLIWPTSGGSVTLGRYHVTGGYDYDQWNAQEGYWRGRFVDTNGTNNGTITVVTKWSYIKNVVRSSSQ
jgi:hypothetical protein